jgi:hypothetical protein
MSLDELDINQLLTVKFLSVLCQRNLSEFLPKSGKALAELRKWRGGGYGFGELKREREKREKPLIRGFTFFTLCFPGHLDSC